MRGKSRTRIFALLALFALTSLTAYAHDPSDHHHGSGAGHAHTPVTVPDDLPVPTIDIAVIKDAMSGWNLHILTTHFRWAPEFASGPVFPGEGHAHLYINGVKVARLYGAWFHIDHLDPGLNEIRVTLNANNHGEYLYQGKPIEATVMVEVE